MKFGDPAAREGSDLTVILNKLDDDFAALAEKIDAGNPDQLSSIQKLQLWQRWETLRNRDLPNIELDAAETLVAAEANERTLIAAEVRRLELAAHWAICIRSLLSSRVCST